MIQINSNIKIKRIKREFDIFEELPFVFGFLLFSVIVSYILIKYTSGPFLKIIKVLAMLGVILHEMCHLVMCIITHAPIEKVSLIKRFRSEETGKVSYYGEVKVYENTVSFLQAFLISFAPMYLSFWVFFLLLNFLINNHVNALVLFLCIFTMISLVLSAAPSSTDLKIIPKAFLNDTNHSIYQVLLIFFSIIATWIIVLSYNLQFIHEIFIYIIIAGFYLAFKYVLKFTRDIFQHFYQNSFENYSRPKKIRFKKYTRRRYKPTKYNKYYYGEKYYENEKLAD